MPIPTFQPEQGDIQIDLDGRPEALPDILLMLGCYKTRATSYTSV
ncbi:MAG: hypothetical protein AB8B87_15040 [Granulosicoccus sp.]